MSGLGASRLSSLIAAGVAVWLATALGAAGSQSPPVSDPATGGPAEQASAGTIQVPLAQPSPEPARPQGVIAGRITDVTTQQPIVHARVIVSADCPAAAPGAPPCDGPLPQNRVALTDADGRYRMTELPAASTFIIRAGHPGYAPQAYGELPPATPPRYVTLAADQVLENVDLALAPEVVLAGVVQDEDGTPFAGALVEALRAVYVDGRRELIAAAEGEFRLSQMSPGQYYVTAFDPASLERAELNGANVTDIPVHFQYGQVEPGLRLILSDTAADIIGTLRLGGRGVLQGYAIVAFSTNPTVWHPRGRHLALVGNVRVLQQLSDSPDLQRIRIREGERRRLDLRAVLRPRAPLARDGDTE
jgi:hypothetical protein